MKLHVFPAQWKLIISFMKKPMRLLRSVASISFLIVLSLCLTLPGMAQKKTQASPSAAQPARIALSDGWAIQTSVKVAEKGEVISTPAFQPRDWTPATVPSTVVAAQIKSKALPEPFDGMNLRQYPGLSYPIGANFSNLPMPPDSPYAVSWWYRKQFTLPASEAGKNVWLNFRGINYRANVWALKELGVTRVIGPTAAGSLQPGVRPGDFVVCDQFVDRTSGRADTYYTEGPRVAHVGAADPYCPVMRRLAVETGRAQGVTMHDRGTVVVIQGPRFSTRAESRWFSSAGWEVINMTQYPEVILARELELCYVNISLITDYDVGLEGMPDVAPVSVAEVEKVFASNNDRVRSLILGLIPLLPAERACPCATAMKGAVIGDR